MGLPSGAAECTYKRFPLLFQRFKLWPMEGRSDDSAPEPPLSSATDWLQRLSPLQRSFALFVITSGSSVVVNLLLRWVFSRFTFFEAAIVLAYVGSTAVAFLLARTFVFASDQAWKSELGRFALVNVVGMVQVVVVGALLLRVVLPAIGLRWHAEEVAHIAALATLAFTSFYLHSRFSFRNGLLADRTDAREE